MDNRINQIGFSQRIRLEWLDQTANLVLAGNNKNYINDSLQVMLQDKVSIGNQAKRGNREKIITILMKIWLAVPNELMALRDDGLQLLTKIPRKNHIAIHWGMATAAYPFWGAVAAHTGRLLGLQGVAKAAHVQRRIREQYGERETAARAARRVLRSFHDWGVLTDGQSKGLYIQGDQFQIEDTQLITWMVEALLNSRRKKSAPTSELINIPDFFPFHFSPISVENLASISDRLDILRHGLDDDLVMLR